jgi:hypothetical protein
MNCQTAWGGRVGQRWAGEGEEMGLELVRAKRARRRNPVFSQSQWMGEF